MDLVPTYSVRTSARARHAHLTVSPSEGVVVVVPDRFDRARIPELVAKRAEWILRAERRIAAERATVAADGGGRPGTLALRALEESWAVEYDEPMGRLCTAHAAGAGLVRVAGATADEHEVSRALARFLVARTREEVVPWLHALARREGARVAATSVRAQRSRWASCSSSGRVSVNRNLLFLPRELAEHVLLHEICHLRELSHAPRFWRLLEAADPATPARRSELRVAWKYVPAWAQR